METTFPYQRSVLLHPTTAERVARLFTDGSWRGGWLLSGVPGIGKSTLGFAMAKALLSSTSRLDDVDQKTAMLVEQSSHPDFFRIEREPHEKTGVLRKEITIDTIRRLIAGVNRTSSTGRRVVLVDAADDLNTAAANALLKVLEEPPADTAFILISSAPGRLLPTIRSRCRQLPLMPVSSSELADWLIQSHRLEAARAHQIADDAEGRPGAAMMLIDGEGAEAIDAADQYLRAIREQGDALDTIQQITAKKSELSWDIVGDLVLARLSRAIRAYARAEPMPAPLERADPETLLKAYDQLTAWHEPAKVLNSDRTQSALAMSGILRSVMRENNVR